MTTTATETRLPGRARPRKGVLREYEELNAKRRERILERHPGGHVLFHFWAPGPEDAFRWRVQLDCGCLHEILTRGDERTPAEHEHLDLFGQPLPTGQMACTDHDSVSEERPFRAVVEWADRKEIVEPADPDEPQDGIDPKVRAAIRHDERTRAEWVVTLSCGHRKTTRTDPGFNPDDGPTFADPAVVKERIAELDALPEQERQSVRELRHWAELGFPKPHTEEECWTCAYAKQITGFQRVGWLVPPPKPITPSRPSRVDVERRLQRAEEKVNQLREQLDTIDSTE